MCRTPKEENLNRIAKDNSKLLDKVILYINTELNIDLYKNYTNIENSSNSINIKKITAFYKQTIIRLLSTVESHAMKERMLMLDIEKGNNLLNYKKSLTVTSVSYGNETSFNNGFKPNTQEKYLIEVEEERKRQEKRILKYDLFMKSFEDNKNMIKDFVELAPNVSAAEIIIRHFIYGQKFSEIAKEMCYEKESLYVIWQRAVDELALILKLSL